MKSIYVTIPKPCQENWDNMTPTEQGRHCQFCQKEVIDFTKMSDRETAHYLKQNNQSCGRFNTSQLDKHYFLPTPHNSSKKWLWASLFSGFMIFQAEQVFSSANIVDVQVHQTDHHQSTEQSTANDSTSNGFWLIKGQVTDDGGEPLPAASIVIKRTDLTVITEITADLDGNFEVQIPSTETAATLHFYYVGFITQSHAVQNTVNEKLQVILQVEALEHTAIVTGGYYAVRQTMLSRFWHKIKRFPRWITSPFRKKKRGDGYNSTCK